MCLKLHVCHPTAVVPPAPALRACPTAAASARRLILFSFAAPGSVVGVGFTFASGGLVLGALMCVGCTLASVCGALLLLKLRTHLPDAKMMSDLGAATIGPVGAKVGLVLQMTNFVLYLPVALMLTGEALQDALEPSGATCQNYFMFAVALVCFASTQARSLSNGAIAAFVCLLLALGVAVFQIAVVVAHPNDLPDKNETKLFGNYLMDSDEGKIQLALALTTCLWAYIPSLLTIELASEMER